MVILYYIYYSAFRKSDCKIRLVEILGVDVGSPMVAVAVVGDFLYIDVGLGKLNYQNCLKIWVIFLTISQI